MQSHSVLGVLWFAACRTAPSEAPLEAAELDESESAAAQVWKATREWTFADELDYADWIKENATTDFLRGSGFIADCADLGMLFRWAYAHDHGLPLARRSVGAEHPGSAFAATMSFCANASPAAAGCCAFATPACSTAVGVTEGLPSGLFGQLVFWPLRINTCALA